MTTRLISGSPSTGRVLKFGASTGRTDNLFLTGDFFSCLWGANRDPFFHGMRVWLHIFLKCPFLIGILCVGCRLLRTERTLVHGGWIRDWSLINAEWKMAQRATEMKPTGSPFIRLQIPREWPGSHRMERPETEAMACACNFGFLVLRESSWESGADGGLRWPPAGRKMGLEVVMATLTEGQFKWPRNGKARRGFVVVLWQPMVETLVVRGGAWESSISAIWFSLCSTWNWKGLKKKIRIARRKSNVGVWDIIVCLQDLI